MLRRFLRRLENFKVPNVPVLPRWGVVAVIVAGLGTLVAVLAWATWGGDFALLQTKGEVAHRERNLLYFAVVLSLLVLIPVYFMLFLFAWRYREGHRKAYRPEWDSNRQYEALWWGIPIAIIAVLAIVTWVTSHSLDPYKPLASRHEPLKVQVIALEWKWLFLYPEYSVASVNEVAFPADRPVEFTITSDGPMNSFWVPQLAGQIYAMSGMSTRLHVAADHPGEYKGLSSNISGAGFADMKFTARAMTQSNFDSWLAYTRSSDRALDAASFRELRQKSTASPVSHYSGLDAGLYDKVVMEYTNGAVPRQVEVKSPEEKNTSQVKTQNSAQNQHVMEGM
ncbi:MAG: ubiquinol oxidase subunit II [Candidatus Saccharimonadales bacterium]